MATSVHIACSRLVMPVANHRRLKSGFVRCCITRNVCIGVYVMTPCTDERQEAANVALWSHNHQQRNKEEQAPKNRPRYRHKLRQPQQPILKLVSKAKK